MEHPIYRVTSVAHLGGYRLRVGFDDGSVREVDLEGVLKGELYGALRDPEIFASVAIDPEVSTLVWPNGADFDPAILHDWHENESAMRALVQAWPAGDRDQREVDRSQQGSSLSTTQVTAGADSRSHRIIPRPVYNRYLKTTGSFENDTLNRQFLARNLTHLFRNSADGLVVAVNAPWGEGKTSFVRFWLESLRADNQFVPIYYDAFKHDFTGDAFVSLAAAIYEALREQLGVERSSNQTQVQLAHLRKVSKALAVDLAKMTTGLAVSSLSGGFIQSKTVVDWISRAFQRLAFGTLGVNADEQFESYLRSQDSIRAYQATLRQLLSSSDAPLHRKVVIFIDELDRCRPRFAVEILEKVKHLFNLPDVFFVLSINRGQLLRTIESFYGLEKGDASTYLQKFVDLEVPLPGFADVRTPLGEALNGFVEGVANELDLSEGDLSILSESDVLFKLLTILKLSARGLERAMSLMALGIRSCNPPDARRLKRYIVVASVIRIGAPEYYDRLRGEGAFVDDSRNAPNGQLFSWAREYFANERDDRASNVFIVAGVREACRLLDMYEIPSGSLGDGGEERIVMETHRSTA